MGHSISICTQCYKNGWSCLYVEEGGFNSNGRAVSWEEGYQCVQHCPGAEPPYAVNDGDYCLWLTTQCRVRRGPGQTFGHLVNVCEETPGLVMSYCPPGMKKEGNQCVCPGMWENITPTSCGCPAGTTDNPDSVGLWDQCLCLGNLDKIWRGAQWSCRQSCEPRHHCPEGECCFMAGLPSCGPDEDSKLVYNNGCQ